MIFLYKEWDKFCSSLQKKDLLSVPAREAAPGKSFLVLKHDVETAVDRAYVMAEIEHRYGHRGSYYVQASLLQDRRNVELLKNMQSLGHEISYHYDVLDSARGNMEKAAIEFETNKQIFEAHGFNIQTVCQHGNPVVERVGYTSNRDFFRNKEIQQRYAGMSDIMVNFKEKKGVDYLYYSDAGRKFKLIYDPLYNDVIPSDHKNIAYDDLEGVLASLSSTHNYIISTHPHRWCQSGLAYRIKDIAFTVIKRCAKAAIHIPGVKKIMSRYYYLAKKI